MRRKLSDLLGPRRRFVLLFVVVLTGVLLVWSQADRFSEAPDASRVIHEGEASFYGHALAGQETASGEPFDPNALTAAHRTLPLGTKVRVTNIENGRSVVVRINDRGPYHGDRIVDLSREAARRLGIIHDGVAQVRLEHVQ